MQHNSSSNPRNNKSPARQCRNRRKRKTMRAIVPTRTCTPEIKAGWHGLRHISMCVYIYIEREIINLALFMSSLLSMYLYLCLFMCRDMCVCVRLLVRCFVYLDLSRPMCMCVCVCVRVCACIPLEVYDGLCILSYVNVWPCIPKQVHVQVSSMCVRVCIRADLWMIAQKCMSCAMFTSSPSTRS